MGYMGLYAQGKRETGENPVRTRHRILRAEAAYPLG